MKKRGQHLENFLNVSFARKPSFSPDGRNLAFISNHFGSPQIYTFDILSKNIKQLTKGDESLLFGVFSPVSEEIVYGKSRGGDENTQLYLVDLDGGAERKISPNNRAQYRFGAWSPNGARIAYTSNERNGVDFDVYIYDTKSKKRKCVHRGDGALWASHFSPSGSKLLLRKNIAPRINELYLKNLLTGSTECLLDIHLQAQYIPVAWRHDEKEILVLTNSGSEFVRLVTYIIKEQRLVPVIVSSSDIEIVALSPDEKYLAVVCNEKGRSRVAVYSFPERRRLADDIISACVVGNLQWSPDSRAFAFDAQSATEPSAVWLYQITSKRLKRIIHFKTRIPKRHSIEPVLKTYRSFDGLMIPVYCFYPKRATRQKGRIPALVFIHGGPDEQYRGTFSPLIQYLVSHGTAVFVPNIRGSSGYGKTYLMLDDGKKKTDAFRDVTELGSFIRRQKCFTPPAIMGISYGGTVALAQLALHPELWSGAISSSGITNFLSYLKKTAPWRKKVREKEYGSTKKDAHFLRKISPVTFADRILSPVLLIHGKNDARVPYTEALQIGKILKKRGVRAELLLFADEGHQIQKRKNILKASARIVGFLISIFSICEKKKTNYEECF